MHGANAHCGPVERVSDAAMCPSCSASAGSCAAPIPMLCGKIVAPTRLLSPCTESMPYMSGICSGVRRARSWKSSIMSAHVCGVLPLAGTDPPPDRMEPRYQAAMKFALLLDVVPFCALLADPLPSENAGRSGWVIRPTFSSSDMRERRSSTRWAIGSEAPRYGNPCVLMTTVGGLWLLVIAEPLALVAVNGTRIVFALAAPAV